MTYKHDILTLRDMLPNGTKVSVKIEFRVDDEYCFNSQIIGFKNQSFIIIDYPKKIIEDLIVRNIKNAKVVIRAKSNTELGHIIAFRTNVLHIIMQPAPMILLKIPLDYVSKPIRKHYRFQFTIPVEIIENNKCYKGKLDDFSVSGCKVHFENRTFFEIGDKIKVKISIFDEEENIFSGTITNISSYKSGQIIGILFEHQLLFDERLQSAIFKHCYPDYL